MPKKVVVANVHVTESDWILVIGLILTAINIGDIAVSEQPLSLKDLIATLPAQTDKEQVRRVLTLIQRDHYAVQNESGSYLFRFPIIRRHWRIYRGLGA